DAVALLMLLRAEHTARCKAGGTFALNFVGMVKCRVLGSWSVRRYSRARDILLAHGRIKRVRAADRKRRLAAEYALCERALTPNMAIQLAAREAREKEAFAADCV